MSTVQLRRFAVQYRCGCGTSQTVPAGHREHNGATNSLSVKCRIHGRLLRATWFTDLAAPFPPET